MSKQATDNVIDSYDADGCTLRFIVVNDVYILDNFPSYATARKQESEGVDVCIGTLAGDFLMPSILSSLDKGAAMVDCMNHAGVDYVCFGNHECDVSLNELYKRIKESKFQWLNSNMTTLPLPSDIPPLPVYKIIKIKNKNGSQTRHIALLGLCTENPATMPAGCFGNTTIEPVNQTALKLYHDIILKEKKENNIIIDCIIPLTHQLIGEDRELADMEVGFPLILGGHEHEVFHETVKNCIIFKAGCDAENIGIIDLYWPPLLHNKSNNSNNKKKNGNDDGDDNGDDDKLNISSSSSSSSSMPIIKVTMKKAAEYTADPHVAQVVKKHSELLIQLDKAEVCALPQTGEPLSSKEIRLKPSTFATFLCTMIRDIMKTDCVLLSGGGIRANRDYAVDKKSLTYSDLKSELPFENEVTVIPLPGSVIAACVAYTRAPALKTPPQISGAFMQTDDGITWDAATNTVLTIAGSPIIPTKLYLTTVKYLTAFQNLDDITPLFEYVTEQKKIKNPAFFIDEDQAIEPKHLIIAHYSKLVLYNILTSNGLTLSDLDKNHDGIIDKMELKAIAIEKLGIAEISDLLINNLFNIADVNGDGRISIKELINVYVDVHSEKEVNVDKLTAFLGDDFTSSKKTVLIQDINNQLASKHNSHNNMTTDTSQNDGDNDDEGNGNGNECNGNGNEGSTSSSSSSSFVETNIKKIREDATRVVI